MLFLILTHNSKSLMLKTPFLKNKFPKLLSKFRVVSHHRHHLIYLSSTDIITVHKLVLGRRHYIRKKPSDVDQMMHGMRFSRPGLRSTTEHRTCVEKKQLTNCYQHSCNGWDRNKRFSFKKSFYSYLRWFEDRKKNFLIRILVSYNA